jgi:hypothetical protein
VCSPRERTREAQVKVVSSNELNTKQPEERKADSVEYDGGDRQHFIENLCRKRLHLPATARRNVQHPRLIASNDPGCPHTRESNGKADPFGKFTAVGNRQDHRQSGRSIGLVFWPAAPFFLLMHGKDFTIPKNTEITAYINGDMTLGSATSQPVASVSVPDPPRTAKLTSVAVTSAASAQEQKTILQLTSEPGPGADIEVDGNFVGQTPSRLELVNGDHTIRLTMNGFAPWERKLHAAGGNVTIDAQMSMPRVYRIR